jgi:hypothetical protein
LPLRLYADECVNGRIVIGLRRRGVDVVTAEDQDLISAGDSDQIARAIALVVVELPAEPVAEPSAAPVASRRPSRSCGRWSWRAGRCRHKRPRRGHTSKDTSVYAHESRIGGPDRCGILSRPACRV